MVIWGLWIDWTALGAIFFGLLLLFELYRYFWPGLKTRRRERRRTMLIVRGILETAIQDLNEYRETAADDMLPAIESPRWLREQVNEVRNKLIEYWDFRAESIRVIRDAMRSDSSLQPIREKWIQTGAGALENCVLNCISPSFWDARIEPGRLRDALMEHYGVNSAQVREILSGKELYALTEALNTICKRKAVSHVRDVKATSVTLAQRLRAQIDAKLIWRPKRYFVQIGRSGEA